MRTGKQIRKAGNFLRQKTGLWVTNRPWHSFLVTLGIGLVAGAAIALLIMQCWL